MPEGILYTVLLSYCISSDCIAVLASFCVVWENPRKWSVKRSSHLNAAVPICTAEDTLFVLQPVLAAVITVQRLIITQYTAVLLWTDEHWPSGTVFILCGTVLCWCGR